MSMTQDAQDAAAHVANSRLLEVLTRAGFVGYGVLHALVAWLALQIAFDQSTADGDQAGALRTLAAQPLGRALVVAVAIGLGAMAVWQALEAVTGHRAELGGTRSFARLASTGRCLVYAYLAWTAAKVFEAASSPSASNRQAMTEQLMSSEAGRWLVGLAGSALAALGGGLVVYGLCKRFEKHLLTSRMSTHTRSVTRHFGTAGYCAKGCAYGVAGVLILVAAVTYDPDKARGLDAALHTLRQQPYGVVLLSLVAYGIAAYGAFCFIQARYHKV